MSADIIPLDVANLKQLEILVNALNEYQWNPRDYSEDTEELSKNLNKEFNDFTNLNRVIENIESWNTEEEIIKNE